MRTQLPWLIALNMVSWPLATLSGQRLTPPLEMTNVGNLNSRCLASISSVCVKTLVAGSYGNLNGLRQAKDHRWEGVAIGAGALGLTAAVLRASACGRDDSATRDSCLGPTAIWGLMGATVGAVVGGLIGSAIPK